MKKSLKHCLHFLHASEMLLLSKSNRSGGVSLFILTLCGSCYMKDFEYNNMCHLLHMSILVSNMLQGLVWSNHITVHLSLETQKTSEIIYNYIPIHSTSWCMAFQFHIKVVMPHHSIESRYNMTLKCFLFIL